MATNPLDLSGANPVGTPSSMDVFNSANQAISFTEQLPDLAQKLREALTTKFSENNPLYAQRESAQQEFLNAPSQARADISQMQQTSGVPLSPTQQEAITSGRRSAAFAPLSSANLMLGSAYGGLENIIGGGVKAFESAAKAQTDRANLMNQLYQQEIERQFKERELALKASGGGTASGRSTALLNQVATDSTKGALLDEVMRKYGTQTDISPNDILRIYNLNSPYGPAKESESELMKKYGIKPTTTAEQRNRQAAFGVTGVNLENIVQMDLSGAGTANADKVSALVSFPLGIGKKFISEKDQNLLSLHQQLQIIKQNVLRAFQGGRISDRDYEIASSYIPSVQDTPSTIKTQLINLNNFINSMSGTSSELDFSGSLPEYSLISL